MKRTQSTQSFELQIGEPMFAPSMASGMAASTPPIEFTIPTFQSGDIVLSIGPLNHEIFKPGDKVKVIVQRRGRQAESERVRKG